MIANSISNLFLRTLKLKANIVGFKNVWEGYVLQQGLINRRSYNAQSKMNVLPAPRCHPEDWSPFQLHVRILQRKNLMDPSTHLHEWMRSSFEVFLNYQNLKMQSNSYTIYLIHRQFQLSCQPNYKVYFVQILINSRKNLVH